MPSNLTPARAGENDSLSELVAERRRRGEISCAECRRLKMRCDKKVPCKSCIRRGCGHLCPNGTNVTADGLKLVLAATNHLHEDISILRDHIRQLEDALNSIHRRRTGETHSLLVNCDDDLGEDDPPMPSAASNPNRKEALGNHSTLAAGQDGSSRLFGSVSDALMHVMSMMDRDPKRVLIGEPSSEYDVELTRCLRHFPFVPSPPVDVPHIIHLLRVQLPDRVTYETLIDIALTNCGSILLMAFTPEYVENAIVPTALYGEGPRALHTLVSLYSLLAIGTLLVVPGPGGAPETYRYGRLSAAAIGASTPMVVSTVELIEGMFVRNVFELMRQGQLEEPARSSLALTYKMCYDIGLHTDASKWNLFTNEEAHHRRAVFWMLFTLDTWESLVVGRPPVMPLHTIDSEPLDIPTVSTDALENLIRATARAALISAEIIMATQSFKPPTYTQILGLDERIVANTTKLSELQIGAVPPESLIRILLHRTFFARALIDYPDDLLKSEYAVSVLATIRGARETLSWLTELIKDHPDIYARMFHVWNAGYIATTAYLALFERAPRCPQAEDAQSQIEHAISLFTVGAQYGSGRARHSLAVVVTRFEKLLTTVHPHSADAGRHDTLRHRTESPQVATSNPAFISLADADDLSPLTLPSIPHINRKRSLVRTTSLPSISDYVARPSERPYLFSTTDDSFYPSYLKRPPTHDRRIKAVDVTRLTEGPDLGPSAPVSRGRTRPLASVGPYYDKANNAALWDGAGWASMQHAMQTNAALGVTVGGMSPPRTSLAEEWCVVNLGGI